MIAGEICLDGRKHFQAAVNLKNSFSLIAGVAGALLWPNVPGFAQSTVVADQFNVSGDGTGFRSGSGVNTGIDPAGETRLEGAAALGLRYISTAPKAEAAFGIVGTRLAVTPAADPGRFVLSSDGATSFDFAPTLGVAAAVPEEPVVYDLAISMANNSSGVERFSFALGTTEGDAGTWDFGIQLYRTRATDTFYTIGKRIDRGASGLSADLDTFITNTAPGSYGREVNFLIRVTDAGAGNDGFHSRIQLSIDGGESWIYDTGSDPDLPHGWRLPGPERHVMWDVAPGAGVVTYDDFSLTLGAPISVNLMAPASGAADIGAAPVLKVKADSKQTGDLAVTFYGREAPKPYPGPDFSIAVLPDTQNYAREHSSLGQAKKEMWYAQTDWIVANRVPENIAYVAQLGDCVHNGDIKNGGPNRAEWGIATNAMYRIENPDTTLLRHGIPYGIAVGNHDQEPARDPDGTTDFYNQFFGEPHFRGRPYYGGHFGANNDNHYDLFSAGGLDFIVLYFEFGRHGTTIMDWAKQVLADHPNRRAIVVTHYAGTPETPTKFSAQGEAIYEALKSNSNFFLMLGGHRDGEGSRRNNYNGNTVWTLISNYQFRMNGGNGWMRMMTFSPRNNRITIKTYSPWLDQYETDEDSEMSFTYNMELASGPGSPGTPYLPIGTIAGVAPGSEAALPWRELEANKTYDWYVEVTDAEGNRVTSSEGRFTTGANTAPVAEGATLALAGDRSTELALPGFDSDGDALLFGLDSRPGAGLLSAFDAEAGTVTYTPAHGFRGGDGFSYHVDDSVVSSSPAQVDLTIEAPVDLDKNGLPDAWENLHDVTDPGADDDGDRQTNFMEYLANTDPDDAGSVLRILDVGLSIEGFFRFTWSSVGGTRYRIQIAEQADGFFMDLPRPIEEEMSSAPFGEGTIHSFTEESLPVDDVPNGRRFYRIKPGP